jgi:hypothetical protein
LFLILTSFFVTRTLVIILIADCYKHLTRTVALVIVVTDLSPFLFRLHAYHVPVPSERSSRKVELGSDHSIRDLQQPHLSLLYQNAPCQTHRRILYRLIVHNRRLRIPRTLLDGCGAFLSDEPEGTVYIGLWWTSDQWEIRGSG